MTPVRTEEEEKKIRAAIERGVAHLKRRLLDKGTFYPTYGADNRFGEQALVGATALAGLALLETGTPLSDPALQHAIAVVRAKGKTLTVVYALGATLFFLNRVGDAGAWTDADRELYRTLALRLVNGQITDGRWTYANPALSKEQEDKLLDSLEKNTFKPTASGSPSASMTQFALLSLWGSRRRGIPVRQSFLYAAERFQVLQNPKGSWDYAGGILHDSNTCAGLMSLAMEKVIRNDPALRDHPGSVGPAPDPRVDEKRDRGIAYLSTIIGKARLKAPTGGTYTGHIFGADAWGDCYFLWCVERVAVIYGWETIGGKDWYRWGADMLLTTQKEDGSWIDRHGDICDTCFAILFLRRANLAQDLTEQLRNLSSK